MLCPLAPRLALAVALVGVAHAADTCSAAKACSDCTALSGCGWCDGSSFDPSGPRAPCLPLDSNATWRCAGDFKNKGQCKCAGTNVPTSLLAPWRGFYIDGTVSGEVAMSFSNSASGQGRVIVKSGTASRAANVTTYQGCPKDILQMSFDDGSHMACSFRLGWQSGGDAHALAMGCNANASSPTDFDTGNQTIELYTCTDPTHCDFAAPRPPRTLALSAPAADPCAALSSCAACSAAAGCSWCLGKLSTAGVPLKGNGHCFGTSGVAQTCSGLTLAQDCSVYKCPWFEYYVSTPPNCLALSSACAAPTTADDADFQRDYPASAYLSSGTCHENCVDPTVACVNGTCLKSRTCDPASTCAACEAVDLPLVMQGLQISNRFAAGLWTFRFAVTADKSAYTAVNITDPAGHVVSYVVREYTGSTAVFAAGTTERGVRLEGLSTSGALGKNVYIALGVDASVPDFGRVMYTPGAEEFALLACEYDAHGAPVSGQYKPLRCAVGQLA
ncbi:hypothetical protein AB1Y20_015661 [Prymnesium parvum]|uniref:DOMON domain-containing protein n=1 Tax=Prymnesium parvum TaxID=97485 RepID=A0AB34K0V8_PRYPA